MLSARLSRHEHWIADLTREAESLLSFIDAKEENENDIYSSPECDEDRRDPEGYAEAEAYYRSLPVVPDMEHEPVSVVHQISDASRLGEVATERPVPAGSEAALHWI